MNRLVREAQSISELLSQGGARNHAGADLIVSQLTDFIVNHQSMSPKQRQAIGAGLFRVVADDESFLQSPLGDQIARFSDALLREY